MADEARNVDHAIVEQIRSRDEAGLRLLLTHYGGRVKGYLFNQFGGTLTEQDIDSAFFETMTRVWTYIESFDFSTGNLRSWVLRIAHNAAIDHINEQKRHASQNLDIHQLVSPASEDFDDAPDDPAARQIVTDLQYVIENKLQGLQQAIIKADLLSDDVASADWLARVHGTTKNSIYVSRQKARANIKKHMRHLADERARQA